MDLKIALAGVVAVVIVAALAVGLGRAPAFASDASPVMYFYSEECHYCKLQKPVLEELAQEGFRVKLMDVGAYPPLWKTYKLDGTPTFMAQNGERLFGFQEKEPLRQWLERHGAKIAQTSS